MTHDQEKRLYRAANALRKPLERLEYNFFTCLPHINNLYLLTLYAHLEAESFKYPDKGPKLALYEASHQFIQNGRQSAPFSYLTPNIQFADNLCQMLNIPFFEKEMAKPQTDLGVIFTRRLWKIYTENWQKSIQPLSTKHYEPHAIY